MKSLCIGLALVAALVATSASAVTIERLTFGSGPPERCSVTVNFGSYASGVDQELKARIERIVERDPRIVRATSTGWGREGESTLCIFTRKRSMANAVFETLKRVMPRTSRSSPTELRSAHGRTFSSGTR